MIIRENWKYNKGNENINVDENSKYAIKTDKERNMPL